MEQQTKWHRVLERTPVPALEHLKAEVSRLFAKDLLLWPPAISQFDEETGQHIQRLLKERPSRPDLCVFLEAFRLTAWDLRRNTDAVDDYWRNQRWHQAGLAATEKPMLLFFSRLMMEQLLALGEATEGRVDRSALFDILEQTRLHVVAGWGH